jgi:hypothetical protein
MNTEKSNEVKKFDAFINEDLEQTTDMMSNTVNVYNKYKSKVVSSIDKEDLSKSEEDFNNFIASLPENEREASDMLRSLFSSEAMKIKIDGLEEQKKQIEEQIASRIKELKDIQSNLG